DIDVVMYFFFQAEDGIRARNVTGVQTCALPISARPTCASASAIRAVTDRGGARACRSSRTGWRRPHRFLKREERSMNFGTIGARSEERRVGKEYRRWMAQTP